MIYIEKKTEPFVWKERRSTPGADFDSLDKTELRESLLQEQGYLCAYCMKRIRDKKDVKIEHYKARNKENELKYENLHAVCSGNATLTEERTQRINPARFTCDTRKGNQNLHINPQSIQHMETIYYDNTGHIYSKIPEYQEDLDRVLNLNDPFGYLISNRCAALEPILENLKKLRQGQDAMPLLRKWERICDEKNGNGEWLEYVGIMRWYIRRQIRKRSK